MNALTDNSLMLRVKSGDLDKMGLLFERYHRSLFSFLYHMTGKKDASEDLVQNVFYRMLKYRHTFTGEGEFRTWMYHLARNVLNDSIKQDKSKYHENVNELADKIGGGISADYEFEKKQDAEQLHKAMAALNEDQREILVLSRFQELKYEEIAGILNITEGAVKVRVHRALDALKKVFLTNENKKKAHDL